MYIPLTDEQKATIAQRHIDSDKEMWDTASKLIGVVVRKKSNNPFKSGEKYNTVKSVVRNPYTHQWAVSFIEDESVVDVKQIKIPKVL